MSITLLACISHDHKPFVLVCFPMLRITPQCHTSIGQALTVSCHPASKKLPHASPVSTALQTIPRYRPRFTIPTRLGTARYQCYMFSTHKSSPMSLHISRHGAPAPPRRSSLGREETPQTNWPRLFSSLTFAGRRPEQTNWPRLFSSLCLQSPWSYLRREETRADELSQVVLQSPVLPSPGGDQSRRTGPGCSPVSSLTLAGRRPEQTNWPRLFSSLTFAGRRPEQTNWPRLFSSLTFAGRRPEQTNWPRLFSSLQSYLRREETRADELAQVVLQSPVLPSPGGVIRRQTGPGCSPVSSLTFAGRSHSQTNWPRLFSSLQSYLSREETRADELAQVVLQSYLRREETRADELAQVVLQSYLRREETRADELAQVVLQSYLRREETRADELAQVVLHSSQKVKVVQLLQRRLQRLVRLLGDDVGETLRDEPLAERPSRALDQVTLLEHPGVEQTLLAGLERGTGQVRSPGHFPADSRHQKRSPCQ